jgi:hypothetical protein
MVHPNTLPSKNLIHIEAAQQIQSFNQQIKELNFDDANIIFGTAKNGTKYRKTAKEMIVTPPEKDITLPSVDVSFTLSEENYKSLTSATSSSNLIINPLYIK